MRHSQISVAMDRVIELKTKAVNKYIEQTVTPLLKDIEELNKKIFEKAYKEIRELEEEAK